MLEELSVTPLGHTLLKRRKEQLEKVLLQIQEGMVELTEGDPGEGFQDGFLRDTQMDMQRMEYQLRGMTALLREATLAEEPHQTETVTLGHKVRLSVTYPSGARETLTVVVAASPELAFVEDHLANGEVPISPQSALGKAIYSKTAGAAFDYAVDDGAISGQILAIEVWRHGFDPARCSATSEAHDNLSSDW